MVEEHKIAGSDLVYAEGESGPWHQTANDPVLGSLFKYSEAALLPGVSPMRTPRRFRKWLIGLPLVAVAGWIGWPYYAVYDLAAAVREGDVSTLEARVEWDSVRKGLRGDLNALLLPGLTSKDGDSTSGSALGTGIAAMLMPTMIDRMLDSFLTPQAIAAAHRTTGTEAASSGTPNPPKNFNEITQMVRGFRLDQIKYAFFSGPLTFLVDFIPDHDPPLRHPFKFRFQWEGNWKLTRAMLPADTIEWLSSAAKTQDGSASPLSSKPVKSSPLLTEKLPPPLQVMLVSKGFKASNIQARDFEDDILIKLKFTNVLDKDIRAFDGVLTFTDILDNEILSSKIAINEELRAGLDLTWKGSLKYNQFMNGHQRLRDEQEKNVKVKFFTRKILFADGTSKEY
jgi:hypothetical protein